MTAEFPYGLRLLPGADALALAAAPELPQKDDLCGPFWALAAVRALGAERDDAVLRDSTVLRDDAGQERAALAAGTRLWQGEDDFLPPGQPPRRDYATLLPGTEDLEAAGTDADGVSEAIAVLSGGALTVARHRVEGWDASRLAAFIDELLARPRPTLVLVNVATEHYRFPAEGAEADYLASGSLEHWRGSPWSAGHFAALLGRREGPGGRLYLVHDTYPLRALVSEAASESDGEASGDAGDALPSACRGEYLHEQPEQTFVDSLNRPGRTAGEILVVARTAAPVQVG